MQTTREGAVTKFWQKADFMIKKVAISQAFRLCFSDELGGMPYTKEEVEAMQVDDAVITTAPTGTTGEKPIIVAKKQYLDKWIPAHKEKIENGDYQILTKILNDYELTESQKQIFCNPFTLTDAGINSIVEKGNFNLSDLLLIYNILL